MDTLFDKLSRISSGNGLDNPMVDNEETNQKTNRPDNSDDEFSFLTSIDDQYGKSGKKKRKKAFIDDLVDEYDALDRFVSDDMIDAFDGYLDDLDEDDEELRDSIISLGRKYHRETSSNAQNSEITKAFTAREKRLLGLYNEISDDKASIQKDIDQMRLARTRNFKALSDMIAAKNQMHSAQVTIEKELNSMTKTQFDLKAKEAAAKKDEAGENGSINSNAIKSLFGLGRGNMVSAMGGYSNISGASDYEDDDTPEKHGITDEVNDDENVDERFLAYEGMGVEYILLLDEENKMQDIIAEDQNGNLVPDYPMPTDYQSLNFNINQKLMSATDDYHRTYKIRYV